MNRTGIVVAVALLLPGAGASASDDHVATLYRSSVVLSNARLHVATFDAAESFEYNWENCQLAADLFQQQPGVKVRYWCERGRYRR
jgi:ABC-type glycerol-3-phosphate transport system substrate-binding protein